MSNDLIKPESSISPASIQQKGDNNILVIPNPNSTVNLNIENLQYCPQSRSQDYIPFRSVSKNESDNRFTMADLKVIHDFSTDYYQLLVTADEQVMNSNTISFDPKRALTKNYVPEEIFKRCSPLKPEGQRELKTFPALICSENTMYYGKTDPDQICAFGYIQAIQIGYSSVNVVFKPLLTFPQSVLNDKVNAIFFNLRTDTPICELNHSAWYVKQANVFEAFSQAGIHGIPHPDKGGF